MKELDLDKVALYIEEHITTFHTKRLESLEGLDFKKILRRKNPYLFKAKNVLTAQDLVSGFLDAHLQSQEETLFGNFIEGVAIFVCQNVFEGIKSTELIGLDLEFSRNNVYYIVEIKSGTNWGNSSQVKKMRDNFKFAKQILLKQNPNLNIVAVNGCCYGIDNRPNKGDYFKYAGQEFWELISGDAELYTKIIQPFGYKAKEKNEAFLEAYARTINKFTLNFAQKFCNQKGEIEWERIVKFVSQKR